MKKMFIAIPLILMGMLFASTAMAHDGAHDEGKGGHVMYEEGSSGSADHATFLHPGFSVLCNVTRRAPSLGICRQVSFSGKSVCHYANFATGLVTS